MGNIGLPKIRVVFERAAQNIMGRAKKGVVGVIVRDTKAAGVYELTDATQIPAALGEANKEYITRGFAGSAVGKPSKLVLVVYSTAKPTGAEVAPTIADALPLLNGKGVDYLAGPHDATEAEVAAIQAFVANYRIKNPTLQAVLPGCAANDRGIINFTSTAYVGSKEFAPAQLCSRIAGAIAGLPSSVSATNLQLEEITAVKSIATETLTEELAQEAAINAGELILVHDGVDCRIARGVNSLTGNVPDGEKKIKVTEAEGLLDYYSKAAIREGYQGKMVNSYDNRCLLVVEFQNLFAELARQGLLLPNTSGAEIDVDAVRTYLGTAAADMDDDQVRQYENLGDNVFILGWGTFADTMENFNIRFARV